MRHQTTQPRRCLALLALSLISVSYAAEQGLQATFEARYQAWRQWRSEHIYLSFSTGNVPFGNIVALGPRAVPFIVEKIERNPGECDLEYAIQRITKKRFAKSDWPTNELGNAHWAAKMYIKWWKEGRRETAGQFATGYAQYVVVRAQGKAVEAETEIGRMRSLGIAALPQIMEKIPTDNGDLVKLVSQLTDRAVSPDAKPAECMEWWAKNKQKWLLPDN